MYLYYNYLFYLKLLVQLQQLFERARLRQLSADQLGADPPLAWQRARGQRAHGALNR